MAGIRTALKHLREGHPLGLFPSGAVSDLSLKEMCIRDRQWQEAILRLIRKAAVPVIPVRFFDRNSDLFYLLGLIDWRIRVLRLPREVLNKKGRQVRVGVGRAISPAAQAQCSSLQDFGRLLRDSVYGMSPGVAGSSCLRNVVPKKSAPPILGRLCGADGTRTRDPGRDRPVF